MRFTQLVHGSMALSAAVLFSTSARASHIVYHGGPVMGSFTIAPLYLGHRWTTGTGPAAVANHQTFLTALANYISGVNAPTNQQPLLLQYGVTSATVLAAQTLDQTLASQLHDSDIRQAITTAQSRHLLPAFGPHTLIMVFPDSSTVADSKTCNQKKPPANCDDPLVAVSYHASESTTAFYGVVFQNGLSFTLGTAHEIFESATDPAWYSNASAWNNGSGTEICDVDTACSGSQPTFTSNGVALPGCADNTQNGTCSSTGFTATLSGHLVALRSAVVSEQFGIYGSSLVSFNNGPADSDGRVIPAGYVNVLSSTGNGFVFGTWFPQPFWGGTGNNPQYGPNTVLGDVDGNGFADAVAVYNRSSGGYVGVLPSTSFQFQPYQTWATSLYCDEAGAAVKIGEVTGDWFGDLLCFGTGSVTLYPSTGSSFGSPVTAINYQLVGNRGNFLADMNGDGMADLVAISDTNIRVVRSLGGGAFGGVENWTLNFPFYGSHGTFIADVDHNGCADAVAVGDNYIGVLRAAGSAPNCSGFNGYETWKANFPFYGSRATMIVDVDGDGAADAVAVNDTDVDVLRSTWSSFGGFEIWYSGGF